MGQCFSTASTSSLHPPTAKVVDVDGTLREHTAPVTAAQALGSDQRSCFLCSSDRLFLNTYIPAMNPADSLVPEQIYFVLPLRLLEHPLKGPVMVALAMKGGAALARASEKHGDKERIQVKPGAQVASVR